MNACTDSPTCPSALNDLPVYKNNLYPPKYHQTANIPPPPFPVTEVTETPANIYKQQGHRTQTTIVKAWNNTPSLISFAYFKSPCWISAQLNIYPDPFLTVTPVLSILGVQSANHGPGKLKHRRLHQIVQVAGWVDGLLLHCPHCLRGTWRTVRATHTYIMCVCVCVCFQQMC